MWRDGQKKECEFGDSIKRGLVLTSGFVYRFQTTGTIEEKIFQRQ